MKSQAILMVALVALPTAVHAEMGLAPVTNGTYVSLEGAYHYQDVNPITSFGLYDSLNDTTSDRSIQADDGWSAGISVGHAGNTNSLLGFFDRIEGTFNYSEFYSSHDSSADLSTVALNPVGLSGGLVFDSFPFGVAGKSELDREVYDLGLALKRGNNSTITIALEPFVRLSDEKLLTTVDDGAGQLVSRSSILDSNYYGFMFAVEPEIALSTGISLAARFAAGAYGYDVQGDFKSRSNITGFDPPFFQANASDDDDGFGFRGGVGAAVKMRVAPQSLITTFVSADYWSDVGQSEMPGNAPFVVDPETPKIDTSDQWDVRAGVRLTVGFGESASLKD